MFDVLLVRYACWLLFFLAYTLLPCISPSRLLCPTLPAVVWRGLSPGVPVVDGSSRRRPPTVHATTRHFRFRWRHDRRAAPNRPPASGGGSVIEARDVVKYFERKPCAKFCKWQAFCLEECPFLFLLLGELYRGWVE